MEIGKLAAEWTRLMAPRTADNRQELVEEAAEYLGIPVAEAWARQQNAVERFRQEWLAKVGDSTDAAVITAFYNESDTELFDLLEWHATDAIHYRTLVLRDLALANPGRGYLDYGSGIGSDAIVFGQAGFDVTLADISDILRGFAEFRCRKRGIRARTIDLKTERLPENAYHVAVCFDVLEHIPKPLPVVRNLWRAMHPGGLLAIHAPFGKDPARPMHVVHHDVVTRRMRSLGFQPVDARFPDGLWPPKVYHKANVPLRDRLGYLLYDGCLNNAAGARLAKMYRGIFAGLPPERARV